MNRPWQTWVAFAVCLVVVFAAMAWISLTVLRLDRAQVLAAQEAALEENIRLALWRMDSALGPLVAQESGRPYFEYKSFYPVERVYAHLFNAPEPGEILLPSPLLTSESPYILLHFQLDPAGELTSPQVPDGQMRELAQTTYTTPTAIDSASARLAKLQSLVDISALVAALPHEQPQRVVSARLPAFAVPESQQAPGYQKRRSGMEQRSRSSRSTW